MRGVVTTRHLVTHSALIVRLFGLRAYLRCVTVTLLRPGQATFLGTLGSTR
jgi:hypothetical protein